MLKTIRPRFRMIRLRNQLYTIAFLPLCFMFVVGELELSMFSADDQRPEEIDVDTAVELGMKKLEEAQRFLDQNQIPKVICQLKEADLYFKRAPENHVTAVFGRGILLMLFGEVLWRKGQKEQAIAQFIAASEQLVRLPGRLPRKNLRSSILRTAIVTVEIRSYEQALLSFMNLYRLDLDEKADRNQLVVDLNNIAAVLQQLGRFNEANHYLEIAERLIDQGSVSEKNLAKHFRHRGLIFNQMRIPDRAVQYFEKSLRQLESMPGTEVSQAEVMLDLAGALKNTRKLDDANRLLNEAFALVRNRPDAQLIALNLEYQIAFFSDMSDKDPKTYAAHLQDLLERAQLIPGTEDTCLLVLDSLGVAFRKAGQIDQSIAAFNSALELLKKYPIKRTNAEHVHKNLGIAFAIQKKPDAANEHFLQSLSYKIASGASNLPGMIDLMRYATINAYANITDSIHTLSFENPSHSSVHGLQATLWTKALYSEVGRHDQAMLQNATVSEHRTLVTEYKELRRKVSKRVLEDIKGTNDARNAQLTRLAEQLRKVERALRGDPEVYRKEYRFSLTLVQDVVSSLQPGEVLLEYVAFDPPNLFSKKEETQYGVYVVMGGQATTKAVPLGAARRIDDAIIAYREKHENQVFYNANDENILRERGETIRKLLLDPVLQTLKKIDRLYVAPDALIGLIPFEVFPVGTGNRRYLVEEAQVVYVTTGRDLVRKTEVHPGTNSGVAWLIGDPAYDATEKQRIAKFRKASPPNISAPKVDQKPSSKSLYDWERLPYTRDAIQQISILTRKAGLPTHVFVDAAASEESLWLLRSPRILVLATHGEFSSETISAVLAFKGRNGVDKINESFFESYNPLQRNMLVLAGANRPRHRVNRYLVNGKLITAAQFEKKPTQPSPIESIQHELGDGLLTAYEVWDMNLQGTELVVLLGCESGLGSTRSTRRGETAFGLLPPKGEGVAGLRQSFMVAGAQSLIMSMWKVPEEDSIRQVNAFFNGWLSDDKPRYEAFYTAQLKALNDAKTKRGSSHPFWWAGFIYYGQPGD